MDCTILAMILCSEFTQFIEILFLETWNNIVPGRGRGCLYRFDARYNSGPV